MTCHEAAHPLPAIVSRAQHTSTLTWLVENVCILIYFWALRAEKQFEQLYIALNWRKISLNVFKLDT